MRAGVESEAGYVTTVEKLGGKKLSPSDRRILRLLINAGWKIKGQRAHPYPWRYELTPPPGYGTPAVSLDESAVLRLSKRNLVELESSTRDAFGLDEHYLVSSVAGRRAFRTGFTEEPIEQTSFLDTPPKRGRNAVDR